MPTIHDDDDDQDYNDDEKEEGKGDDYDSDDFEGFPEELSFAGSSNKVRPHSSSSGRQGTLNLAPSMETGRIGD